MTDKLREAIAAIFAEDDSFVGIGKSSYDKADRVLALAAAPQPVPGDDWRKDPSADDRWSAGCDYAMTALCKLLCINTADVTWDAATEELEGDVLAVLGNILTMRFGDDWRRSSPQPAPADREALVDAVNEAMDAWMSSASGSDAEHIADALLARGLRLPAPKMEPRRCAECDCEGGEYECTWIKPGPDRDNALQQLADLGQQADRAPEPMAWAVVDSDGKMVAINYDRGTAQHLCNPGGRVVRVAIRVLEGGDDAA